MKHILHIESIIIGDESIETDIAIDYNGSVNIELVGWTDRFEWEGTGRLKITRADYSKVVEIPEHDNLRTD